MKPDPEPLGAPRTGAAYIRVSTNDQLDLSPQSQLDEINKYAAAHKILLPDDYIFMESEGHSGRKAANRPMFQQMIAAAKEKPKPFDVILLWKFSRFARNQDESTFYKSMLRKRLGIDVVSISEPVLEGMYGRLIEMIIEWQDEFYSYNLGVEVTRGMTKKAELGGCQCRPPFGYRLPYRNAVPEIVPEEAAVVRLIFEKFVGERLSACQIARYLNGLGLTTGRGRPFETRAVTYILENPCYCGYMRWNRTSGATHREKEPSEWIVEKGRQPPIVPEALYKRAGELLAIGKAVGPRRPSETAAHWLSGLVKCSACGRSLVVARRKAKDGRVLLSFQCGGYLKGTCRVSHSVSAAKLEAAVLAALQQTAESAPPDLPALLLSPGCSDAQKNAALKAVLEKIVFDRASMGIDIYYRAPDRQTDKGDPSAHTFFPCG